MEPPSWLLHRGGLADEALAAHVMRPRQRSTASTPAERQLLLATLLRLGKEAAASGSNWSALAYFESAYDCKEETQCLISAIECRLRLGQLDLAARCLSEVLRLPLSRLTGPRREKVERLHDEAAEAVATRAREGESAWRYQVHEDEAAQLLEPRGAELQVPERADEAASLLRLMRLAGHHANERGDADAARAWFECSFSLSSAPSDLLSAANMRVKSAPTSSTAARLYDIDNDCDASPRLSAAPNFKI